MSLDAFSSTRRSVEMRFERESNWFSRCTNMLVFWRWWCCVIPDNRARCDGLQLVIAVSLYIHGPSSWFGGLSFPSGSWAVLMVSPTVKTAALFPRLPVSPPWSRSNWRADALVPGDYSDIKEDQRRRSSWNLWFLFLFFFCNGKRKVLIFQMLVVQIKIISICGLDWCLRIVFWHLIHIWDPFDLQHHGAAAPRTLLLGFRVQSSNGGVG